MKTYTAVALIALALASPLWAQEGGPPGDPGGPDRPYERIQQLRKVRLVEMLEMKEEQSVRFISRYNAYEEQRKKSMADRGEVMDRLERLVRNKADSTEYTKAFAEVIKLDDSIIEQRKQFFLGLGDLLTIEQRAKLLLFERRFQKELREAMREAAHRRRQEPGGDSHP
jgi:hypothetical protein